ncbi:trihelix transcription factor ASR3-like [Olea europaea var. sylvestris]|uniref:trihelix transcription factor ASR3-like n=1 Tax=Olea europaea var. sylvestris TaxID=158386 RepID=UPI000C1CE661|nr:trihelix transcription factor ASR3-like [Olea europaea var. sylvestris]
MANEQREYRKGNWTVAETMVLIEAKKMDDERRLMIRHGGESSSSGKPGELRWKRVEDYCWKNGCLRSHNQCNDKWDNLMRDFKKVREYQRRVAVAGGDGGGEKSYWKIDKNERKEHSLPSNMLPQIFDALVQVMERKSQAEMVGGSGGGGVIVPAAEAQTMLLPLQPPAQAPTRPFAEPSFPTVDSDTSEHSESPAKRRRRSGERGGDGGDGAVGGGSLQEVCSAISQSGSTIAEAIQSSEEREERRHREVLSLHERRLQIEESNAEINRQGINGIVDAINKLANSMLDLASQKNQPESK